MPLPQTHITPHTLIGGRLVPGGGATFRAWAPAASRVHVTGTFNQWTRDDSSLLVKNPDGRWTGFVADAKTGDEYLFHVEGEGSQGNKRDPYACELILSPAWPHCHCLLCDHGSYPWHDQGYRPPPFEDLIVYQLHIGCYYGPDRPNRVAKFLDFVQRIEYLARLGVNAVQLMPIVEFQTMFSMGYNGTDYFSPEMDYEVTDETELQSYLQSVNDLLAVQGHATLTLDQARGSTNQLKILVDLCHLHGLAVILDVVYNHAGGSFDDQSLYFFDRQTDGDANRSLYFTDQGWAGGLIFAFWKEEVRQFLIDNAVYCLTELHMDGLRYDEVSVIDHHSDHGWRFCQELTATVRHAKPEAIQNAEYWPVNPYVVRPAGQGGADFDTTQHDALRDTVRAAVGQASRGMAAQVAMKAIADALPVSGFTHPWQAVTCVENHDLVYQGREPRIPALADGGDPRSWYARSRSRVATGLVLTAPGIPMLFMGQELLEPRQWHDSRSPDHLLDWSGLEHGDRTVTDHLRFTRELIELRRWHPALRRGAVHVFHSHDENRVLAFHRWIEGEGRDLVVIASLNDSTFWEYCLGLPLAGEWTEAFNSDVYDGYVNSQVAGNGGRVVADGGPLHGLPASAKIVIPANSVLVLTRDAGD
ncbi:MAG TPA: alpha amylase C-terminal domain-containing protein [Thermoanaerobaculia bacterium]|nr:alpha amylase C-terminal domain-containing protein [Thermoanaerobaculia bacterium]